MWWKQHRCCIEPAEKMSGKSFFIKCKLLNQLVYDETFEVRYKLIAIVNYKKKKKKKSACFVERKTLVVKVWSEY